MSLATSMSTPTMADDLTQRIVNFLITVGLEVRAERIEESTFLPGIQIQHGVLIVDESRLKYPGDLLHEAGHLAIVGPEKRRRMGSDAGIKMHEEMAAIAWSWAALTHLRIAPSVVFHADGYKGGSQSLIDAFSNRCGPGIPILARMGLCSDPNAGVDAIHNNLPEFPTMTRWLCQSTASG